jgi:PilZ domain-containing protein
MSFNLHPTRMGAPQARPVQRYPRALFSVPVTLRHLTSGGIQASPGISLDISSGGLGAIVHGDLRVGEMVEIDVRIPGHSFSAVAVVRYTSDMRSGFEFVGMTQEERQQIANATGHA